MKIKTLLIIIMFFLSFNIFGFDIKAENSCFKINTDKFKSNVHIIAMLPVFGPQSIPNSKDISKRYETLITSILNKANIKVIPPEEYFKIHIPIREKAGALYDPMTGKPDEEKLKQVNEQTIEEMKKKHSIDSFIIMRINIVKISWNGNSANWDGVYESTTGKTGLAGFFAAPDAKGSIPGLSLTVSIFDTNEILLYFNAGGIQLLKMVSRSGLVDIPTEQLFTDKSKDVRAVNIAMKSFCVVYGIQVDQN
jgi:hypothetical protein